jgi:hypothetical protein
MRQAGSQVAAGLRGLFQFLPSVVEIPAVHLLSAKTQ